MKAKASHAKPHSREERQTSQGRCFVFLAFLCGFAALREIRLPLVTIPLFADSKAKASHAKPQRRKERQRTQFRWFVFWVRLCGFAALREIRLPLVTIPLFADSKAKASHAKAQRRKERQRTQLIPSVLFVFLCGFATLREMPLGFPSRSFCA